jgi:polyisoprenoid-binding protein YceI
MRAALILSLTFFAGLAVAAERPVIYSKSEIAFTVKQMGVGVSGTFKKFTARINLDPTKLEAASAGIEVDVASISTGTDEGDDEALKGPWLDAMGFPKATFNSNAVRALGGDRYEAKGTLRIKGTPRELTVPFTFKNQPDGTSVVSGELGIRRTDFGIGGGEWNEGDLVANEVPVRFRLSLGAQH